MLDGRNSALCEAFHKADEAPFLADFQSGRVTLADGFQYFVSQMRPWSRGRITLKSANPAHHPAIRFNYLSDPRDVDEMVAGIRQTLEMTAQPAWSAWPRTISSA